MVKMTAHKILRAGFSWLTFFKDAHQLVRKCDPCKRFSGKLNISSNFSLKPVNVQAPFQQCGIDFIGEISCK